MARRFVSGFMYETDATFGTNSLKLPLSVMVGIDNCGKTFPVAYVGAKFFRSLLLYNNAQHMYLFINKVLLFNFSNKIVSNC